MDRAGRPGPRGRDRRASADAGVRGAPARGARRRPRALRVRVARLPAVARSAHGQRARRGRPRDRSGAGRVLRPRRARGPARHAVARAAGAEPEAHGGGDAADDVRRANPARPRRGARGPRALSRTGVRHRDPAQRPRRRGPELRQAGDSPRSALRRARTRISSSQRRSQPVADRQKGMGRGLAAILSVAPKDDAEELGRYRSS